MRSGHSTAVHDESLVAKTHEILAECDDLRAQEEAANEEVSAIQQQNQALKVQAHVQKWKLAVNVNKNKELKHQIQHAMHERQELRSKMDEVRLATGAKPATAQESETVKAETTAVPQSLDHAPTRDFDFEQTLSSHVASVKPHEAQANDCSDDEFGS